MVELVCPNCNHIADFKLVKEDYISKQKVKEVILGELKGINEDELNGGWWETSTGVSFGKNKLNKILKELGLKD